MVKCTHLLKDWWNKYTDYGFGVQRKHGNSRINKQQRFACSEDLTGGKKFIFPGGMKNEKIFSSRKMKKSLVLAMAMALGVTASAYAANPFSDVPAGHWAYDAVNKLAAAGVVDGYPDGTYGGDKLMTRYEMAQIVAKAMAKGATNWQQNLLTNSTASAFALLTSRKNPTT